MEPERIFDFKDDVSTLQELKKELESKELRFIGVNDSWITEYDWIGYHAVGKFLSTVVHPVRAYKLWAEIYTCRPLFSWKNKLIWWSIEVKPTDFVINLVPELVGKTILLENSRRYFKNDGYSGHDHFVTGTVAEFRRNFVCLLNMRFLGIAKKREYTKIRKDIFRQFYRVYPNTYFYKLLYRKQKPALYALKYPKFMFHTSWVRLYNETKRNRAWRGDKGAKKVRKFFNSFPYRKTLEFEPLRYVVSTSLINYAKLIDKVLNNDIKSLDDILSAIQFSRDASRVFFSELISTKDVKLPLIVETKIRRKYKKESFPRGQVSVIQTLFQMKKVIKWLNKNHNLDIPLNGVYEFKGQSRGRSSTTTPIFEDISATVDLLNYPLLMNVNVLLKNSTEFVKQRLIEDRLFKLLSYPPHEKSYIILADITHPDDFEEFFLPELHKRTSEIKNISYPVGWIDIGVHVGVKREVHLGSVYGAIKYSRSKYHNNNHVDTAERILLSYNIREVSSNLIMEMDELFEKYGIKNQAPRDLNQTDFMLFTIDFVKKFLTENYDN